MSCGAPLVLMRSTTRDAVASTAVAHYGQWQTVRELQVLWAEAKSVARADLGS